MSDHVTTLTTDLLVHELKKLAEWQELGICFGLSHAEIMEIDRDHPDIPSRRMAMLEKWMRKQINPSWEMVVKALEKMSEQRLADQLRVKYCTQLVTQHAATLPGPEIVIELDWGDAIGQELENFGYKYLKLVTAAESALKNANPSPKQIEMFSQFHLRVEVVTVEQLFDQMKPFSFLEYKILENIISFFQLKQDQAIVSKLDDCIQQLKEFKSSTTVEQFMERIETAQKPLTASETCTVTLKLVGGWLEKTITDLDKLLKVLFQDKSSVLSHLRIVRGEGGGFSSKSPLMKTTAGNSMFTSNNYV